MSYKNGELDFIYKPITGISKTDIEEDSGKSDLQLRFEAFHRQNPHVLDAVISLSKRTRDAGRKRGSISQIFEVLRYTYSLRTAGSDYKLANAHRAFYARIVMALHPELSGEEKPFFLLSMQRNPYTIDWEALNLEAP